MLYVICDRVISVFHKYLSALFWTYLLYVLLSSLQVWRGTTYSWGTPSTARGSRGWRATVSPARWSNPCRASSTRRPQVNNRGAFSMLCLKCNTVCYYVLFCVTCTILSRCYIINLTIYLYIVLPGKVFRRALDTGCINKLSAHDVIMYAYEQLHTAEREISSYISQSASMKTETVALDALWIGAVDPYLLYKISIFVCSGICKLTSRQNLSL